MDKLELLVCQVDRLSLRERRQGAILDAAETLFLEQGYEGTSLAEIVKLSGGSLATLYELFGNKQGLLHAIAARWRDEAVGDALERNRDAPRSHADMLMDYARQKIDTMKSPRAIALIRMLISEALRDRAFALQTYHAMHLPALREVSDLFAEWTAAGEAEIDDPDAAAKFFFALVSGDSMLNVLIGVEEDILDEKQIHWRLQPFLDHFKIGKIRPA